MLVANLAKHYCTNRRLLLPGLEARQKKEGVGYHAVTRPCRTFPFRYSYPLKPFTLLLAHSPRH